MRMPTGLPELPIVPEGSTMEERKRIYDKYILKLREENDACNDVYKRKKTIWQGIKSLFQQTN